MSALFNHVLISVIPDADAFFLLHRAVLLLSWFAYFA